MRSRLVHHPVALLAVCLLTGCPSKGGPEGDGGGDTGLTDSELPGGDAEEDRGEDPGPGDIEDDGQMDAPEGDADGGPEDTIDGDSGPGFLGRPSIGQTAGGAALESENFVLNITVGVPQPMGARSSSSYRMSIGLPMPGPTP